MKIKNILAVTAIGSALTFGLVACAETYSFEAVPVGVDDDDAEQGLEGDPSQYDCFTIEADSSNGDDEDKQLGTFCKTDSDDNSELEDED